MKLNVFYHNCVLYIFLPLLLALLVSLGAGLKLVSQISTDHNLDYFCYFEASSDAKASGTLGSQSRNARQINRTRFFHLIVNGYKQADLIVASTG